MESFRMGCECVAKRVLAIFHSSDVTGNATRTSDRPAPHRVTTAAQREILHIHKGMDWSTHCLLSPLDCKLGECSPVPWVLRG
jgi:hypothetical protein